MVEKTILSGVTKRKTVERICNYVQPFSLYLSVGIFLLLQLTVTVHEAVNTTSCIDKLALARVERMRGA